MRKQKFQWSFLLALIVAAGLLLSLPQMSIAGKNGYMGGAGKIKVDEGAGGGGSDTGGTGSDTGGSDGSQKSDTGKLFGDLYRILRQQGIEGDQKLVPQVDAAGPVLTGLEITDPYYTYFPDGVQLFNVLENSTDFPDEVIGGEPVLTVIDPGAENDLRDYGWYAVEAGINTDGTTIYEVRKSPYPAQCVQPVASFERWGDISSKTGLTRNRLPLIITYDATWKRSECEVGQLNGEVTVDALGELEIPINSYFIEPCDVDAAGPIPGEKCQWSDPTNGLVTYPYGVTWSELVEEVHFGRLNMGRSPEAVLQSAFDEAISTINSDDTIAINIDAAGRLLLTKNVYDEIEVDPNTGMPLLIGTIEKAIDSPLENLSLYVKLMQDGHLVTPADERLPIDRSVQGGIPLWKMLELEDGPAEAALRPTIDIAKMAGNGLGALVDVTPVDYYSYYQCLDGSGTPTDCFCWNPDPVQPEQYEVLEVCDAVVSRTLTSVTGSCPVSPDVDNPIICEGPFTGILDDGNYEADSIDMNFTAAFLAAAADKTGDINIDMVVYLNSILGLNKVIGYSEYDAVGNPTSNAIDYSLDPQYYNFRRVSGYLPVDTFNARGDGGSVWVLQGSSPTWTEQLVSIIGAQMDGQSIFDTYGQTPEGSPTNLSASENILGFVQQADDNLSVIEFIHTYQIPAMR